MPEMAIPGLFISIAYPGASPDTVEREIVNRLEKSLMSVPGATKVESSSNEGNATFVVEFNFQKNMIEAAEDVRNVIATVRYKMPIEMRDPIVNKFDPSAQPIMNLALSSSSMTHAEISRMAEDHLADKIRGVAGVATVQVNGALKRELSVLLHAAKMREYNVSAGEVVAALRAQNTNAPVGKLSGDLEEESLRLVGRIESPKNFKRSSLNAWVIR